MDERLEKALDFSNYMVTLNSQKRLIQEKYQEDLMYYTQGCQFTVTKELITFVGFMLDRDQETVVITDDNKIPIQVTDIDEFYNDIVDVYFSASNNYFEGYQKLKKNRSVSKLIENE